MNQVHPVRCSATTRQGRPCRAWAVRGSDPSRCASHGGSRRRPDTTDRSAERDDTQACTPARDVDLRARIADLDRRIARLSAYIDRLQPDDLDLEDYARLVALHGQLCSRLGRLLRDQQQLGGTGSPELEQAMREALDLAGNILGTEV